MTTKLLCDKLFVGGRGGPGRRRRTHNMSTKSVYMPDLEDAVPDSSCMGDSQIAYGIRSALVVRHLVELVEKLQSNEMDGCYYGEDEQAVRSVVSLLDYVKSELELLALSGKEAGHESRP